MGDRPAIYRRFCAIMADHGNYRHDDCQYGLPRPSITVIPIGTAFAISTGIVTADAASLFNEPRDLDRLFFIFVIIRGIAGLKLSSPA